MSSTLNASGNLEELIEREWLATNKLGGYACSSLSGMNTRKYHGLLVAAMTPPVRRMVLLSKVEETVTCDGWPAPLSCNEYPGTIHPQGHQSLIAFEPTPYPRWAYQGRGWTLLKELRLLPGENTVCLRYTLLGGDKDVELQLRPLFALRGMHELMFQWNGLLEAEKLVDAETRAAHARRQKVSEEKTPARDWRIPATTRTPEVFFSHDGTFENKGVWYFNTIYRCEESRGYSALEDLWSPGMVNWKLSPGKSVNFVCSSDPIQLAQTLTKAESQYARTDLMMGESPEIVGDAAVMDAFKRAADQFVVEISDDVQRGVAVIGHYPWTSPTSRAALIGMNGLFLIPGKFDEAKSLIASLLGKMDRGVIPSEFPENGGPPLYKSADVSLWLIHAMAEYLRYSPDDKLQGQWLDKALEIIDWYRKGTLLGIKIDDDGLMMSHESGMGTSWMDAKVGDWVITPRVGKTVEGNALWFNALKIALEWASHLGRVSEAKKLEGLAAAAKESFNTTFWNEEAGCCFDVVNGKSDDASVRPNQLLAISLPHSVLEISRHEAVLERVIGELMTPVGVRTLSPKDPNYHGRYRGNVVERDRAYHQGTAYPWLLGPLVTSYLRLHGRGTQARREARQILDRSLRHILEHGQLCELFDGDSPYAPGGAIASALAVGEISRVLVEEIIGIGPVPIERTMTSENVTPPKNRPVAH